MERKVRKEMVGHERVRTEKMSPHFPIHISGYTTES